MLVAVFYIVNVANAATQPVVKVNGLVCENKSGVTAGYILLAGKTGSGTVTYIVGAKLFQVAPCAAHGDLLQYPRTL